MASERSIFGFKGFSGKTEKAVPPHQPYYKEGRSSLDYSSKTTPRNARNLLGLLKIHGARSRRASLPKTKVRISVLSPNGQPAIRISL